MLGRMWSQEMAKALRPAAWAAATKSRAQMESAAPRVKRAKTGTLKMPMAIMELTAPGPKRAVIITADSSGGKGEQATVARKRISSFVEPDRRGRPPEAPTGTPTPDADGNGHHRHHA